MSKKIQWYILVILAVFFNAHCWADKNNTLPEKVAGSFVLPPFMCMPENCLKQQV